jgi:hypothetical protein
MPHNVVRCPGSQACFSSPSAGAIANTAMLVLEARDATLPDVHQWWIMIARSG